LLFTFAAHSISRQNFIKQPSHYIIKQGEKHYRKRTKVGRKHLQGHHTLQRADCGLPFSRMCEMVRSLSMLCLSLLWLATGGNWDTKRLSFSLGPGGHASKGYKYGQKIIST
jgi:hypothetical protein